MAINLQTVKNFPSLIEYLRTELGWPIDEEQPADDLTFDYRAEELGLDQDSAVKVRSAKQLRRLPRDNPGAFSGSTLSQKNCLLQSCGGY